MMFSIHKRYDVTELEGGINGWKIRDIFFVNVCVGWAD